MDTLLTIDFWIYLACAMLVTAYLGRKWSNWKNRKQ